MLPSTEQYPVMHGTSQKVCPEAGSYRQMSFMHVLWAYKSPSCGPWQASYVRSCIQHSRLREACHAVRHFGLAAEFPTVQRDFRAHSMRRLMEKALWAKAACLAEGDNELEVGLRAVLVASAEAPTCQA